MKENRCTSKVRKSDIFFLTFQLKNRLNITPISFYNYFVIMEPNPDLGFTARFK